MFSLDLLHWLVCQAVYIHMYQSREGKKGGRVDRVKYMYFRCSEVSATNQAVTGVVPHVVCRQVSSPVHPLILKYGITESKNSAVSSDKDVPLSSVS